MASVDVVVAVTSPPSTSVSVSLASSYPAPVPANTVLSPITVLPAGWSGSLALSGPDAGMFQIAGSVAAGFTLKSTPIATITIPKNYNFTINATP